MIEDHRGVVSGDGATVVRAERLAELLDREILPCLERPSRLIGPFDGVFRGVHRTPDVAFIWPSLAEGPDTPEALRSLLESALLPPDMRIGLACAPAPDVERALVEHGIPWFVRPSLQPLADVPAWVVWIETPLQLLGLLSVFAGAGVPHRAAQREGQPRVLISGPAVARVPELAAVYADLVVSPDVLTTDGFLASWVRGASVDAATTGVRAGGQEVASGPGLEPVCPEKSTSAHGPRSRPIDWSVVVGTEGVRSNADARLDGRGDAYTRVLRLGSASSELRRRHGFVSDVALNAAVEEVFEDPAGEVAFELVVGLPGETEADRAAIARLMSDSIAAAPRGARQVRARIGCHVPRHDDLARGDTPLSPAEVSAAHDHVEANLPTRRTRVDRAPAALGAIEATLATLGADAAPVLETVHVAGGRRADAESATDAGVWSRALGACGHEARYFAEPADGPARYTGVASPTGLTVRPAPEPERTPSRRRKRARRRTERPDRWARWEALVPRQFDHRIEFAKQGRLRFLGAGEVTEVFLRACERAGVPMATSGVAQPRPRIRFGPSLPTGIEGTAEVVDLGLEMRFPDLLERLRPHVPEELDLRRLLLVPVHASDTALSRVALVEYEATLSPELWTDPGARARSRARIVSWHRRLLEGLSVLEDADDDINQLRTIELSGDPDGIEHLRMVLDIRGNGTKVRPREVLERGMAEVETDVRCIPLRRLRLLVIEDDMGRERLMTPIEQAVRVERRLRARAKLSA